MPKEGHREEKILRALHQARVVRMWPTSAASTGFIGLSELREQCQLHQYVDCFAAQNCIDRGKEVRPSIRFRSGRVYIASGATMNFSGSKFLVNADR